MGELVSSLYTVLQWQNIILMLVGTTIGVVVGVLPGIGAVQAMALLIPLTFKMDVTSAFVLLISIYATSKFGGSLTAILFNIPGDNPNAVTLIDGFPMAKQGKARTAIAASAAVSIMGGLFSALTLLAFMPLAYQVILRFGPAEFFMLALFGLTAISAVSAKSIAKGLIGGGLGVLVSTIGYHAIAGQARFTFGTMFLQDGVGIISGVLGLLALSMAIQLWMEGSSIVSEGVVLAGSVKEGIAAVFRNIPLFVRTCLISWVIGVAPGAGSAVAGFVCYASAAKSCKNPENFGKGDIRGVIAGDTAIHACSGGDLLPTVTLGIPGSGGMAVLLGAFAMHGIAPGPAVIKFHIDIVYVIVYTLFIAHCASVVMAVGISRFMEKLTKVRAEIIAPLIIVLCLVGSYLTRQYWQDLVVTTLYGIFGYYMRKHGFHPVSMLLGIILGPIAEYGFYSALEFSDNGAWVFFTRIPSLIIFLCILTVIFWPYVSRAYKKGKGASATIR